MKKKIPTFGSDKEAQDYADTADLTEYDPSGRTLVQSEYSAEIGKQQHARADLKGQII